MKGQSIVMGGVLLLATAGAAQAQKPFLFFGGGPTFPTSLYKNDDGAKTGWMASAGIGVPVGKQGVQVGAEVNYGSNKHKPPPTGDKTNLYGISGWAAYRFGASDKPGPYLLGSAGTLKHDYRSTAFPNDQGGDFKFAWSLGGGVDFPLGSTTSFYVEGRYFARSDTKLIGTFVGLTVSLGK